MLGYEKYLEYIKIFYPKATISKTNGNLLRFAFVNHDGSESLMGASIPIWMDGTFKPARVRLIRAKTELLSVVDIIKKLDAAVNFGGNQFKVGQSEWEMVTFSEKNHWVFPLGPTACAYSKLNEYFAKLRGLEIEVLQVQGDFGVDLSVRKVLRTKHH